MSVIAWDGKTLAADRRACFGTLIRTITKIFRAGDCLIGYAGDADSGEAMRAWYSAGADPATFPESQRGESWAALLVIKPSGDILRYERTPHPVRFPPQHFAAGSGQDFAHAAMYLGKSAEEAVLVACALDSGCGNGVDVLTHGGPVNDNSGVAP